MRSLHRAPHGIGSLRDESTGQRRAPTILKSAFQVVSLLQRGLVEKGPVAGPNLVQVKPYDYATPAAFSAARTRTGVNGGVRIRTPVASKNALAIAAGGPTTPSSPKPAV